MGFARSIFSFQCISLFVCFSFPVGHCVVCPSLICGFWLALWYQQTCLMGLLTFLYSCEKCWDDENNQRILSCNERPWLHLTTCALHSCTMVWSIYETPISDPLLEQVEYEYAYITFRWRACTPIRKKNLPSISYFEVFYEHQ